MKRKQSLKDQAIDLANKREYARKYYQAHKQEARAYYILNRGRIRYIAERWRRDNRERYLAQQAEYDRTVRPHRTIDKSTNEFIARVKAFRSDAKP